MDMVKNDFSIEALRVFLKAFHQFGPLHAHGIRRPVIHIGSGHELAALGHPGDDDRVEVGAGGIDRRGISGRAGTEDEQAGVFACHCFDI